MSQIAKFENCAPSRDENGTDSIPVSIEKAHMSIIQYKQRCSPVSKNFQNARMAVSPDCRVWQVHTRDFFLKYHCTLRKGVAHLNMGVAPLFEAFILPE